MNVYYPPQSDWNKGRKRGGRMPCKSLYLEQDYMLVASVPVAARAVDCRTLSLLAGLAISAMPAITRPYRVGERETGET